MKSWEDYEKHFAAQSANEKGDLFEQFCKALIATHKSFMAKDVYLGHEIPTKEVNDAKLTQLDRGHDGLFIQTDGTRVVFQAKYRKNANLTHTELSTFFNVSEFADQRMIFRTTGLSKEAQEVIEKKNNVRNIDIDFFKSLTQEDFIKINDFMEKGRFSHPKPRPLWPIQEKALQDLISLPHSNKLIAPERATCVMPCGTGKTLLSIRYAEKIKAKRIVVLLPSLMLIEQAMKDWCTDSLIPTEDFSYHVICSDQKKSRCTKNDDIYISKSDLPFLRSTDKEEVSSYVTKNSGRSQVIFCTYQSSPVLMEGLKLNNTSVDLIIFDEAHRTAGREGRAFSLALDDKNIPSTYRLFLTATPKHVDFRKKDKEGEYKTAFSMDDESVYGSKVMVDYQEAIENGRICDYKVIISALTSSDIQRKMIKQGDVFDEEQYEDVSAQKVAHEIAIGKAIDSYNINKIITFHQKIDDARAFSDDPSSNMPSQLSCQYIKGTHSRTERSRILSDFESSDQGLLANARCLTEGVNIPSVDCVAFLSPKRSKVDIIQAIGRAMRKDPNNKNKRVGYVLLPLFIEENKGETDNEAIEATCFDEIWDVLTSLKEFDPILAKIIDKMSEDRGRRVDYDPFDRLKDKIEIIGLNVCSKALKESIQLRISTCLLSNWHIRYGELKEFKKTHGHCNVPKDYPENPALGRWCHAQRQNYKNNKLAQDKIKRLDDLGFIWDPYKYEWNKNYDALVDFKSIHGHCNVPYNYSENPELASWCDRQRQAYKYNKLAQDKIKRLDDIGFVWDLLKYQWKKNYDALVDFKSIHGHCHVPRNYPENPELRIWCDNQRQDYKKNKLAQDKIKRLEDIGFIWDPRIYQWNKNYDALVDFKSIHGHCHVPRNYPENPGLGIWCDKQRQYYKNNKLSNDKIKRLEDLGFIWNILKYEWNKNYDALVDFKSIHGHCNVPQSYPKNPVLGIWCDTQRQAYKKNKLAQDKIKQLGDLGFSWSLRKVEA